jgi:predicted Zn-dependent protease
VPEPAPAERSRPHPVTAFESRREAASPEEQRPADSTGHPAAAFERVTAEHKQRESEQRRSQSDETSDGSTSSRWAGGGPPEALAFFNEAVAAHLAQDYERALDALDTALALDPGNRLYETNRIRLLKRIARSKPRGDG